MGAHEFLILDLEEKANLIFKRGVFLDGHNAGAKRFVLYSLSSFYVEIVLTNETLTEIAGFNGGERLDKYTDKITIPAL